MYTHIRKQIQSKYGNHISRLQNGGRFPNAGPGSLAYRVQLGIASPEEIKQYKRQIELESENMEDATNWSNDIQTTAESIAKNQQVAQDLYEARKNDEIKSLAEDIVNQDSESGIGNAAGLIGAGKSIVNSLGKAIGKGGEVGAAGISAGIDAFLNGDKKAGLAGTIGGAGVMAVNAVDQLAMGDKNFGSQSEAIDGAVHTVSGALMKSGNVWAMAAGAALEGANFLTKAGGQTVQGFDVDIDSSGYGNIGHMESSSSRSWVSHRRLQDKLARRNEQARAALAAAQISEDQKFESEARMNSVENTIMNNQIALAGGLQTNLLGS